MKTIQPISNPQQQKTYTFSPSRDATKMPEKSFRSGAIQVAIWENEGVGHDGQPGKYQTVSFERRYKDKQTGEWKSTTHLRVNDLPKAALILNKAYEYLVLTESQPEEDGF